MFSLISLYVPSFGQRIPNEDEENNQTVTAIVHRISNNETDCYSQLYDQLQYMCPSLDAEKRIKLSTRIMICERTKDGRYDLLPNTNDEIEFAKQLNNEDLQMFAVYFNNIDYICYSTAKESQSSYSNKKTSDLYTTMTLISRYVSDLSERHKQENIKMQQKLAKLSKEIDESTNSFNNAMELIINLYSSIDVITSTVTSLRNYFKMHTIYFYLLVYAFLLSFLVPSIFPLIFSVTLLKIIADSYISVTNVFANKLTMAIYYASCVVVLILCVYLRLQEIKHRIFGPPRSHI